MEGTVTRFFGRLRELIRQFSVRAQRKLLMIAPNDMRVRALRTQGVRIGENCLVYTMLFSTEPYLVEIGDHVAISAGTEFITHDGSPWVFEDQPDMDVFGRIRVGSNTFFGMNCTILPGADIGSNCIIGAGSVVRGVIPDDSVVMGNPARVVMKTSLAKKLLVNHRNRLDTRHVPAKEKEEILRRHFGLAGSAQARRPA
jgi:acetyltransferase-like isoleucine patch superfamily enzyme